MVPEREMVILQRTERSMVRAMCGVQLKDIKLSTDLMFVLGLIETTKQCSLVRSCIEVRGWSCVEVRGWSCVEVRGRSCVEKGITF